MALIPLSEYKAKLTAAENQAQTQAGELIGGAQGQAVIALLKENAPLIVLALGGLIALVSLPAIAETLGLKFLKKKVKGVIKDEVKDQANKKKGKKEGKKKKPEKKPNSPGSKNKKGSKKPVNEPNFKAWDLEIDLDEMPDKPGVYKVYTKKGLLYIGKATSLKKRLNAQLKYETPNSQPIINSDIVKLEYTTTPTVEAAAELERELIKKEKPLKNTYTNEKPRKPPKTKPKNGNQPKGIKKGWVKLKLKDPSKFKPGTFTTKEANKHSQKVLAIPEDGEKLELQSMRFKTEQDLINEIPELEKQHNIKIVKKGDDYGALKHTGKKSEPKKDKKDQKTNKKTKRPNITQIAKNFNKDLKPGDKVSYKSGRNSGTGKIKKIDTNVFIIETDDGESKKVLKTMVKKVE